MLRGNRTEKEDEHLSDGILGGLLLGSEGSFLFQSLLLGLGLGFLLSGEFLGRREDGKLLKVLKGACGFLARLRMKLKFDLCKRIGGQYRGMVNSL
jgi:hypothetical protein